MMVHMTRDRAEEIGNLIKEHHLHGQGGRHRPDDPRIPIKKNSGIAPRRRISRLHRAGVVKLVRDRM